MMKILNLKPDKATTKEKHPFHYLSFVISAVAVTVIFLFMMPWLVVPTSDGERALAGIDVAVQSTLLTDEEFTSGLLFILPLVALGFLWEHYRKLRSGYRPRRRLSYAGLTAIGLIVFVLWIRLYALAASDCLQSGECVALKPEQASFSAEDVVRNLFTTNIWIYAGLSLLLLVLPFWDTRPAEPRPD